MSPSKRQEFTLFRHEAGGIKDGEIVCYRGECAPVRGMVCEVYFPRIRILASVQRTGLDVAIQRQ